MVAFVCAARFMPQLIGWINIRQPGREAAAQGLVSLFGGPLHKYCLRITNCFACHCASRGSSASPLSLLSACRETRHRCGGIATLGGTHYASSFWKCILSRENNIIVGFVVYGGAALCSSRARAGEICTRLGARDPASYAQCARQASVSNATLWFRQQDKH